MATETVSGIGEGIEQSLQIPLATSPEFSARRN